MELITITPTQLSSIVSDAVKSALAELKPLAEDQHPVSYLTRQETAKLLGITLPTLQSHTISGNLRTYRIGRRVLYRFSDIEKALKPIRTQPK